MEKERLPGQNTTNGQDFFQPSPCIDERFFFILYVFVRIYRVDVKSKIGGDFHDKCRRFLSTVVYW